MEQGRRRGAGHVMTGFVVVVFWVALSGAAACGAIWLIAYILHTTDGPWHDDWPGDWGGDS